MDIGSVQVRARFACDSCRGHQNLTFGNLPDESGRATIPLEHFLKGTDRLRFAPVERSGAAELSPHPPLPPRPSRKRSTLCDFDFACLPVGMARTTNFFLLFLFCFFE
ncbi:MAG: hypothetical protein Q8Q41_01940 [bacterium]|nr:hypothetical protein [bacterium]